MEPKKNYKWENHIGEQKCIAELAFEPTDINQVQAIVLSAEKNNKRVRAVGSGHSWSPIGLTNDYMILPYKLTGELDLEQDLLLQTGDLKFLVRVKSGTTIRSLNKLLEEKGLSMSHLGGFDGQTIAGVNATSTHGSVIKKGPLYESIVSYDLVGSGGKIYRIEKTNGITNAMAFKSKYPLVTLIQDDHFYNAVSVNVGCLGVIFSVMLKAVPFFYMKEYRPMSTWNVEKQNLANRKYLDASFHYEILVNPYEVRGARLCLNTFREKYTLTGNENVDDRTRNFIVEFLSWINRKGFFNSIIGWFKRDSGNMINNILNMMKDKSFIGKSYHVFHIGEANYVPSLSSEIAIPMKNNLYLEAIDKMFEIIQRLKQERDIYFTGPIAIRFVRAAEAYLSPMYGEDTCMIELIMPKGSDKSREVYISIERALIPYGARLHWGQYQFINDQEVAKMYPALTKWKMVKSVLNSTGVFGNEFTSKLGL